MKFKIFGVWEQIYKKVILLFVILFTFFSIYWYHQQEVKPDTFVISTIYALILFFIGIYVNYMENKISEKFYIIKEYYVNLLKVKGLLKGITSKSYSDTETLSSIISFKIFGGREFDSRYIEEKGFKFNYKELEIEDIFIKKREDLLSKFETSIIEYAKENSLSQKYLSINIDSIFIDVETWCEEHYNLKDNEIEKMKNFIYGIYDEYETELSEIKLLIDEITKLYNSYKEKVNDNINLIKRVYGERLENEIYKEEKLELELALVKNTMKEIKDDILNTIEEIKDDIRVCIDQNEESIKSNINLLYDKLDSIEYSFSTEPNFMNDIK